MARRERTPGLRVLARRPRSRRGPRRGDASLPRAKKRLSQNFLVDQNVARRIVELAQLTAADTVLEIGPGTGSLTGLLIERAERVHAVELDRELFERLGGQYELEPRLVLHQGDVLEVAIDDLAPGRRVVVVGNLPYAITSDLVLWLLEQRRSIRRAVVLMQREVAERLTAEPGERASGSLTLAVRYWAEAERILDVSPGCFRPVPRVHSSLVAFRFREEPAVHPRDEALFFRVIRSAFGERRKTLANALAAGLGHPRPVIEDAIRAAGIDPRIRGERLGLEEFRRLADVLGESLPALSGSEGAASRIGEPERTEDEAEDSAT